MAYVTPGTVAAGDVATAAAWNVITNDIIQIGGLAQGVFTNEAARDAAITSPTEGMHAYITASGTASASGDTFAATPTGIQTIYNGANWVCVTPISAVTATTGSTTSLTYTPTLTSGGTNPSVTLSTGTSALVSIASGVRNSSAQRSVFIAVSVNAAAPNAAAIAYIDCFNAGWGGVASRTFVLTGLSAGTNTFVLNYKSDGAGTGSFQDRSITVQGVA